MLKSIISICILFTALSLNAQASYPSFENAKQIAIEQEKQILLVFSGSDWCKPCIQLKSDILDTNLFKEFEANELVFLYLDFPYKKKNSLEPKHQEHNDALAEKYNSEGVFPKVLLLNPSEEIIGTVEYHKDMSPSSFVEELSKLLNK